MIISIRGIYEGLFSTHSAAEEKASETEIQFYREGFECQLTTGAFIILTIIILYIYYHVPDTVYFYYTHLPITNLYMATITSVYPP